MNILFIIPSMARGGAEIFLSGLALYLAKKGHSISLVSGEGDLLGNIGKGINVYTLTPLSKNILKAFRWIFFLRKKLKNIEADIICSNSVLTSIVAFIASYLRNDMHRVLILHNPLKNWYFKVLQYFADFGLEKIISVSETNRKELMRLGVKKERLVHISTAVDVNRFPYKEKAYPGKRPVIGVIARIEEYKGHRYLIDAIKQIEEERAISFDVHLCGDGTYREQFKEYIAAQRLKSNIIFWGSCNDVPSILQKTDIFVLPSYVEAFPISILEAMSGGVPVIATKVGDIPEIIKDGETGLLVEPKDSTSLKNALLKLIDDDYLYRSISKKARLLVEKKFSEEDVFNRYEEIFNSLVQTNYK